MAGRLSGKTAVVVGATSGMGRATALLFAREGASVVVSGRRAGLLQEVGEQIVAENGVSSAGIPCDVTQRDQVRSLIAGARAQLGRIDILVYATGMNIPERSVERLQPDTWERMLATNLTGAYHCTQELVPVLREQGGGLILYVSSIAARRTQDPGSGIAYIASKAGMDGIAGGVFAEERADGIRTSVIYPGLCDTPLVLQRPTPPAADVLAKALQPEDVAEACLFVAALPERCHVPELVLVPAEL